MGELTTTGGDRCPVCGERARRAIDLEVYDLFECGACRCWSSSALSRGAVTSFEPEHYFANADSERSRWAELLGSLGVAPDTPLRVLDVGCSNGHFLAYVRSVFPRAVLEGIELDPTTAARAQARVPEARIRVGDAERELAQLTPGYDLVTLWDVFEHLTAPIKVLEKLSSLLSADGRIFIQTINEHSALPAIGRSLYKLSGGRLRYPARRTHDAHHLVFFSKDGFERAAGRIGLSVARSWYDRLSRERMDGSALVTAVSAAVLTLENALGNGLFINFVLTKAAKRDSQL
jgi:2-polyprenyl-3-methyl-5-hydroxy-6-metoxy-1,4-benzoquinol methylase